MAHAFYRRGKITPTATKDVETRPRPLMLWETRPASMAGMDGANEPGGRPTPNRSAARLVDNPRPHGLVRRRSLHQRPPMQSHRSRAADRRNHDVACKKTTLYVKQRRLMFVPV